LIVIVWIRLSVNVRCSALVNPVEAAG
jgi:hypothetical protein